VADPDETKNLYGYSGPYYNTTNLDGRVVVLDHTLYTWPTSTWKVSGMLRNQARTPVHIAGVTARLLGSKGQLLATASGTVPVSDLRPGEPGPFVIVAPVRASDVKATEWHIDYVSGEAASRLFVLDVVTQQASAEDGYYYLGEIQNAAPIENRVHMVAAWLDWQGRVLFVDSPKLRILATTPGSTKVSATFKDAITLAPGESSGFVYINKDPVVVPLLARTFIALWGISN
jgi:hypothetical protein